MEKMRLITIFVSFLFFFVRREEDILSRGTFSLLLKLLLSIEYTSVRALFSWFAFNCAHLIKKFRVPCPPLSEEECRIIRFTDLFGSNRYLQRENNASLLLSTRIHRCTILWNDSFFEKKKKKVDTEVVRFNNFKRNFRTEFFISISKYQSRIIRVQVIG